MEDEIARKLDTFEAMTPEERVAFGKALFTLRQQPGWKMLAAVLRQTQAATALTALHDKTMPREYYEGMVDMIDLLNVTIDAAIQAAQEEMDKEKTAGNRTAVLTWLKPGGGSL